MKKQFILTSAFFMSALAFAQVGIGTNTPSATLDIVTTGNTSATKALEINNSSAVEMVTVLNNGNVGIGTTAPTQKLHIKDTDNSEIILGSGGVGADIDLVNPSGNKVARLVNASNLSGRLDLFEPSVSTTIPNTQIEGGANLNSYFNTGGNVGIGTTAPGVALEVQKDTGSAGVARFLNLRNGGDTSGITIRSGLNTGAQTAIGGMIHFQRPDGTEVGAVRMNSASSVGFITTSDERLKENVKNTHYGINDLMKIKVVDYNYKDDKAAKQTGFLAQQLNKVFPEAVNVGGVDAAKNPWGVDYGKMTPIIIKAVQDQQGIIEAQKAENKELKAENEAIKAKLEVLEAQNAEILKLLKK